MKRHTPQLMELLFVGQRGVNRNDDRLSLMFYLHRMLHILQVHIRTMFNASIGAEFVVSFSSHSRSLALESSTFLMFGYSEKATQNLTLLSNVKFLVEDFFKFCGLLRLSKL